MRRTSIPIILFSGGVIGLSACSDSPTTDAGPPGDTGVCVPTVHNPCPGDGGVTDTGEDPNRVQVTDPEGGGMLFEYITFDNVVAGVKGLPMGVTTVTRVVAHFINDVTPDRQKLPGDADNPAVGSCYDLTVSRGWPEFLGTNPSYIDVGTLTVTGVNAAGAAQTLTIPRAIAGAPATFPKDDLGRPHDIFYQLIAGNAAAQQKPGSFFSVQFGGNATFPAATLTDAMYLPLHFDVMEPGLNDVPTLSATADFPVKWSVTTNPMLPEEDTAFINLVSLVEPASGALIVICPVATAPGAFTIPKEMIASYRSSVMAMGANPDQVVLLRNNITHHWVKLPNQTADNKRRIDFLAVYCYAQFAMTTAL